MVIEAKMYSNYSEGTANAKDFDQVSRTVGCMCNTIYSHRIDINTIKDMAFYTFIPKNHQNISQVKELNKKENINKKIIDRLKSNSPNDYWLKINSDWHNTIFVPFIEKIKLAIFTWDEIIDFIESNDKTSGLKLKEFYNKCKNYNMRK